jgi:Xaa-Pro dipeptidase
MRERVKRIFGNLDESVDAIYIKNSTKPMIDPTFFYITGFRSGVFEGSTVILYPDGAVEAMIPPLEEPSAQGYGLNLTVVPRGEDVTGHLRRLLKGCDRIGINAPGVSYGAVLELEGSLPQSELVDVSGAIGSTMLVKDDEELGRIRRACRIASRVARELPDLVSEGVTESDVAAKINVRMQRYGATSPSFTTISSFGRNTAEPHYTVGRKRLKQGQLALFDFGAKVDRYSSDITRTFVCGTPKRRMVEMYETVREAQDIALEKMVAGNNGRDVHLAAQKHIDSTKFKGRFIHGTGHSIGLGLRDSGVLHSLVDLPLEERMVFTVEPGVYIPGYGGVRIEDDVVVRKGKCEILTKAPRRELVSV